MTYKATVKEIAMQNGSTPPSCPSPSSASTAAACTPTSPCSRAAKTPFYDANDKYHLSANGKSYIAGLLKHAREFTGRYQPVGELLQAPGARL
jgi:glutamine synthetase